MYHGNYEGALSEHSYKVLKCLEKKNELYNLNIPMESIIISGLGHDFCKINFYKKGKKNVKEDGRWIEKDVWMRDETNPLGHGHKSVIMLLEYIKLTDWEKYAIIYHMGIPEDYEGKQGFNKATELYPSIICLYTADFESSKLFEKTIK
jgi:hypothetical protein